MWTRGELKELGKRNFKRVYKQSVIVCIIVYLIGAIFDGGYNSANNSIKSSVTYNYEQSTDIGDIYENEGIEDEFDLNNGVTESPQSFLNFSAEGIIVKLFENVFNAIINLYSGISATVMVLITIFIMIVSIVLRMFILNPITIGKNNFFMGNRENERKIGDIFFLYNKSKFIKPSVTMFFVDLFTFLWTLLLVIPGIVKSYEYLMIPYILSENPDMDRKRAFELSKYMMNGQKWDTFVLDLSFIGWNILSSITLGILGIFYVNPYIESTYAELYAVLRGHAIQNEFADINELPGFNEQIND